MYIKKILWVIAILGLAVVGFFAYYIHGVMLAPNTSFSNNEAYIFIAPEDDYNAVRTQLKPLLKDINTFDVLAKQKKYVSNVKSGKYIIKKGMSNNDIINSIRSRNIAVAVAFNNQGSLEKLAGRVSKQLELDSLELLNAMQDTTFLRANGFTPETALGMYLPNTYQCYWNSSPEKFRAKMLNAYHNFWNTTRMAKAKAINLLPNYVITLASIVYEESKQPTEQPRIAGVYLNRLRLGIPLQADPTLKFAAYKLPEYSNTVIKRVLNKHKLINSPYNTYLYQGLPPGLITMPNISAIEAVLNYEKHNYIYFAADPKRIGFHKFAKTLAQHNANARGYQNYLSSQGIRK